MALTKRCRSFLFEPLAYLNDPAVLKMNTTERGAYSTLLFSLWDMPEPGVVDADDSVLALLSRANGEWPSVKEAVSRAFDLTSRPGRWVQKRMIETHKQQSGYVARQVLAGRRGGKKKWENEKARLATSTALANPTGSGSGSGSGSGTEETKTKDKDTVHAARAPRSARAPFVKPSPQEIKDYCLERRNGLDPALWYDHYESNGWMVGRNPMKSWKAAVRTWERQEMPSNGRAPTNGTSGGDYSALEKAQRDRLEWEKENVR